MDMPRQHHPDAHSHATGTAAKDAVTIYTCPMHPEVRQDAPGKCPKCGMFLEPEGQASAHDLAGHAHHDHGHHHDVSRHDDRIRSFARLKRTRSRSEIMQTNRCALSSLGTTLAMP